MTDIAISDANASQTKKSSPPDVIVRGHAREFAQRIEIGRHHLRADEPEAVGGTGSAPDPYEYVLAGLGACTSMTVGMYARRSKWPLEEIVVRLHHSRMHAKDCADCDTTTGMLDLVELEIELTGDLSPEQRAKLIEVAHKCPVHRTLKSELQIRVRPAA